MELEIKGLNSLMAKLSNTPNVIKQGLYKGVGKTMTVIEGDAKDICAVDKGELRNSIHSKTVIKGDSIEGTVGTNKEYAVYVEMGTGQRGAESPSPPKAPVDGYREDWTGMEAQPYLYPSLMQNKETANKLCTEELQKELSKLRG
nr:HK97-gp10 family putative phage morphogenesis protein [uncultured Cellulosilyticum sp.]